MAKAILALFIFPTIFEREIKDLEYMAYLLFLAVCLFFLTLISYAVIQGPVNNPDIYYLDNF